ncbi:LOW QUALITY PROTEIN: hypothetical protein HID58_055925 [Brassica napus]|uniref:ABC transporter domain-containing protein n=1 Tax=Brassica napus TaxID=3708 RepID=A0ABQ8AN03_BRANA|nr:LOW QUALITY PROTEIN: hypothetical protein HID58_055925 [Brassica napus]
MPLGNYFNIWVTRVPISASRRAEFFFIRSRLFGLRLSLTEKARSLRGTLDRVVGRSSPPHWLDVSGTFRRETVQPLLPLIGTSTMCLQCDPCVSEAMGFLRINLGMMVNSCVLRDLKAGHSSSTLEKRRTWWGVDMLLLDAKISISINSASMVCSSVKLENIRKSSKGVIMLKYVTWEVKRGERAGLVTLEFMGDFKEEMEITKKLEKIQKALYMGRFLDEFDMLQRRSQAVNLDMLILGLWFVPEDADRLVASFSGGWQMRMSLRNIQLQDPELLLLDEPTNHLDLDTIEWLEGYFQKKEMHMVIISHDRAFLISCVPKLWKPRWLLEEHSRNAAWEKQQKETESTKDLIARLGAGENFGRVQLPKRLAVSKIYGYIFKAVFGGARFLFGLLFNYLLHKPVCLVSFFSWCAPSQAGFRKLKS